MTWIKPGSFPGGSRIINSWEPVIVKVPKDRKGRHKGKLIVDYLICPSPRQKYVGTKPVKWTNWVLEAMGVRKGDTVDDLFNGSGLVSQAIAEYLCDVNHSPHNEMV
jgi:hypothetical protein